MVVTRPHARLEAFSDLVDRRGLELYRDLPWRNTDDPYEVLLSEVMLQQTQVSRVQVRWDAWLAAFPTLDALAAAPLASVLERWQGMGYNRRAVALKNAAVQCADIHAGEVPDDYDRLLDLPGVGPSTAAGVRIFAYGHAEVYLETNVRTVFIHELFGDADQVSDKQIIPLVEQTCDKEDPRRWYYALMDYGNYLKKTRPNPSRRSKHHTKQSNYEGSNRQKRAILLREALALPGSSTEQLSQLLTAEEMRAGRDPIACSDTERILSALRAEGFLKCDEEGHWFVG